MTEKEFKTELKKHGMRPNRNLKGYVNLGIKVGTVKNVEVFAPNAGNSYTRQLAYLLRQRQAVLEELNQRFGIAQ
jgi:hypothetical protein